MGRLGNDIVNTEDLETRYEEMAAAPADNKIVRAILRQLQVLSEAEREAVLDEVYSVLIGY